MSTQHGIDLLASWSSLTPKEQEEIQSLYNQLSTSGTPKPITTPDAFENDSYRLFLYRLTSVEPTLEERIIGMTALTVIRKPYTGDLVEIHDVVVDKSYRGRQSDRDMSYAEELLRHVIRYAQDQGFCSIDLTSKPDRVAANKFYQRLGFELRATAASDTGTNLYRLSFE